MYAMIECHCNRKHSSMIEIISPQEPQLVGWVGLVTFSEKQNSINEYKWEQKIKILMKNLPL